MTARDTVSGSVAEQVVRGTNKPPGADVSPIEDILKGARAGGSDKSFTEAAAKAYEAAAKKHGADTPKVLSKGFDDAVEAGKLSKETAEIFKAALKDAKDAQDFAARLGKDRDQLATSLGKDASKNKFDLSDNPFVAMMLAIVCKMCGMNPKDFGINMPDKMKGPFDKAHGPGGRPQGPQRKNDFVGPPTPEQDAAARRQDATVAAQAPAPTVAAPQTQAATSAPVDITAANDIDFATITDGSRPASSFAKAPSAVSQMLEQPKPGAFTTTGPATGPLNFSFDNPSLLAQTFAIPANPDPAQVQRINPFGPVAPALAQASAQNDEVYAKAKAGELGFGT
jgi:hypothetical protein